MTTELKDEAATGALGKRLAAVLRPGDVVALSGGLGAGKTTLARAILAGLGHAGEVPSPTFAIVQPYEPPDVRIPVWHVDLYRIEAPGEALELGLEDARREAALIVEWPDRLDEAFWDDALRLHIAVEPDDRDRPAARRLTATVPQAWEGRWQAE